MENKDFTQEELFNKYKNIENHVPGKWSNMIMAALNLKQDLELYGKVLTPDKDLYRTVAGVLYHYDPKFFDQYLDPTYNYNDFDYEDLFK